MIASGAALCVYFPYRSHSQAIVCNYNNFPHSHPAQRRSGLTEPLMTLKWPLSRHVYISGDGFLLEIDFKIERNWDKIEIKFRIGVKLR